MKWFKALPIGALVITLAGLAGRSTADDKAVPKEAPAHFLEYAKACHDCARICDACSTHCAHLIAAGKKGASAHPAYLPGLCDDLQRGCCHYRTGRAVF